MRDAGSKRMEMEALCQGDHVGARLHGDIRIGRPPPYRPGAGPSGWRPNVLAPSWLRAMIASPLTARPSEFGLEGSEEGALYHP